jgi:hypothetical protein
MVDARLTIAAGTPPPRFHESSALAPCPRGSGQPDAVIDHLPDIGDVFRAFGKANQQGGTAPGPVIETALPTGKPARICIAAEHIAIKGVDVGGVCTLTKATGSERKFACPKRGAPSPFHHKLFDEILESLGR